MIRLIIVDDEILSRIGIQTFVDGKEEISVSGVFESAEDAIEFLRENMVDIVITDIEMAKMNGLELIQRIRKENLADGVIILSCHDDFAYAQEAISMGTDSYLLKHSITEEAILKEIHKVYEKTKGSQFRERQRTKEPQSPEQLPGYGKNVLGILCAHPSEEQAAETQMDRVMLIHLIEGIVEKYQMGTLFTPYNKQMFIIFRFPEKMEEKEWKTAMETNLSLIVKNISQYINGRIVIGLSSVFTDLKQVREKYEEAKKASGGVFYEPERDCFWYHEKAGRAEPAAFTSGRFLEQDGLKLFEAELSLYLNQARFLKAEAGQVKEQLIQAAMLLAYEVMKEYGLREEFVRKWKSNAAFVSAINLAGTWKSLRERLLEAMGEFRGEVQKELEQDDLFPAMSCIEKNLGQKITLLELAESCCMSIPTFSKKFKERTGYTAMEYINIRRIEKAKSLMKNRNCSLWEIAETTGFSNANYLVRVFKKVTGQTASEYRRQYGIEDTEIK